MNTKKAVTAAKASPTKASPASAKKPATTESGTKATPVPAKAKATPAVKAAAKPVAAAKAPLPIEPMVEAPVVAAPEPEPVPVPTDAVAASPDADTEGARIARDPAAQQLVVQQFEQMLDPRPNIAVNGARVLAEILVVRPELLVPHTEKLTKSIASKQKRVVQTAADALPVLARIAPARVARYLDFLRGAFGAALEEGQDGLVRTFSALCVASVAYQRRLEPVLTEALAGADGKVLLKWTQIVLPALKGEPHARARAVVEGRLESLPRPVAQPIADFLGVKLRPPRPR